MLGGEIWWDRQSSP